MKEINENFILCYAVGKKCPINITKVASSSSANLYYEDIQFLCDIKIDSRSIISPKEL